MVNSCTFLVPTLYSVAVSKLSSKVAASSKKIWMCCITVDSDCALSQKEEKNLNDLKIHSCAIFFHVLWPLQNQTLKLSLQKKLKAMQTFISISD